MRYLYLHGFASGPDSRKGVALAENFAPRGVRVQRLNLRLPSMERLRLSAMLEAVRGALSGAEAAVLMGSSLGGLAAARAAEGDGRVKALVLLAPGFRVAEVFRARLGERGWREWEETGWLETEDHAEKRMTRVDFGFMRDAMAVDAGSGGWPEVKAPCLVVHGTSDDVIPVGLSRRWAAGRSNVRLVEVEDGHDLAVSIPRILQEVDAFLQEAIPPGAG